VFHTLGRGLMEWVKSQKSTPFSVRSVFLVPLSEEEIAEKVRSTGAAPADVVYRTMKEKLQRRKQDSAQKIEQRARSAFVEMQNASYYTDRIVNHAGEDARDEWGDPLGSEAQRVLEEFVAILRESEEDEHSQG